MAARVLVRAVQVDDQAQFIAAVKASKRLHGRWVSPPATTKAFDRYVEKMSDPNNCGLLVIARDTQVLVGVVNVSNIILGPLCSAFIGYYGLSPHDGQGLMTEGLRLAVRYAFGKLGLHRIEANIQPENVASIALAARVGFCKEGFSPRYLKINGRWRDHERWAIVKD
jgi:[ribosomal protein S5]-alanine N-acetyltransferase